MIDPSELKILLVIENETTRTLTRTALRTSGVRNTLSAVEPRDVSEIMNLQQPDAMITMLNDPSPNDRGLALIRAIRSKSSPNRYLPIVVLSPILTRAAVTATINAGGHEFVGIPFSGDSLWRKLSSSIFVGWPFVETASYFGPCRRRFDDPKYKGDERREGSSNSAASNRAEQEKRMDQIMESSATKQPASAYRASA